MNNDPVYILLKDLGRPLKVGDLVRWVFPDLPQHDGIVFCTRPHKSLGAWVHVGWPDGRDCTFLLNNCLTELVVRISESNDFLRGVEAERKRIENELNLFVQGHSEDELIKGSLETAILHVGCSVEDPTTDLIKRNEREECATIADNFAELKRRARLNSTKNIEEEISNGSSVRQLQSNFLNTLRYEAEEKLAISIAKSIRNQEGDDE